VEGAPAAHDRLVPAESAAERFSAAPAKSDVANADEVPAPARDAEVCEIVLTRPLAGTLDDRLVLQTPMLLKGHVKLLLDHLTAASG
jgi:hypothetical protein